MNTIFVMTSESYLRLRKVMSALSIEMSDAELARKFNLPDQHITHWKKRGVPKDILIELSDEWKFRIKYVRDGEGEIFERTTYYEKSVESEVLKVMQHMDAATKYQYLKIGNTLAEPETKPNGTDKK